MMFQITTNENKQFTVDAESFNQAAIVAARKINRRKTLTAQRTTGDNSKSGYFRAYETAQGGLNSVGEPFHVAEA